MFIAVTQNSLVLLAATAASLRRSRFVFDYQKCFRPFPGSLTATSLPRVSVSGSRLPALRRRVTGSGSCPPDPA